MTVATESVAIAPGWLRRPAFDVNFIIGITALALVSGWVVVEVPALFMPILLADLWLLGYHHVIATYTRLCFDRESFRAHRFLAVALPVFVLIYQAINFHHYVVDGVIWKVRRKSLQRTLGIAS